jgi:hypothetical protein
MKSFLSDRPRVPAPGSPREAPSALSPGRAPSAPACSADAPGRSASVETVREGDRVVRIVVTCACGERTEIDCLYASGS